MVETPRPFLKWAGGKTVLAPQIIERIPSTWNRETDLYVEPFLGAGAVFFALQPNHALLNDANARLINAWESVRTWLPNVELALGTLQAAYHESSNPEEFYREVREVFNAGGDPQIRDNIRNAEQAARFIFLNKACFNGLWRENSYGLFNVPWGKRAQVNLPTIEHLQCCQVALSGAKLLSHDFAAPEFLDAFDPRGALIYCDPPYAPTSKTANFTSYTADGFEYATQLHLIVQACYWRGLGAHVILSQSANESLIEQYRRVGFRCDLVQRSGRISSKGDKRESVGEYIIY